MEDKIEVKNSWINLHNRMEFLGHVALVYGSGHLAVALVELIKQHDILNNLQTNLFAGISGLIFGSISYFLFDKYRQTPTKK